MKKNIDNDYYDYTVCPKCSSNRIMFNRNNKEKPKECQDCNCKFDKPGFIKLIPKEIVEKAYKNFIEGDLTLYGLQRELRLRG